MVDINCDMGEAFSIYRCGDDEGLMPLITVANVACGFHASDPSVMRPRWRWPSGTGCGSGRIRRCPTGRASAAAR